MVQPRLARRLLLSWYRAARRDLPWRATRDPWRILVSEVMLQQTRVSVVAPYYERFLARFPTPAELAAAPEADLLSLWSGLGYYSRARNLKLAAAEIVVRGGFPASLAEIRALPGVGEYTSAAIASIAFQLPHAVLDGNVLRVLSRLLAERGDVQSLAVRVRLKEEAQRLLDTAQPGDFNQALMELGATVCLPRNPQCLLCPWRDHCEARASGIQDGLPIKSRKRNPVRLRLDLFVVEKAGKVLLRQRGPAAVRLAGFWELPTADDLPAAPRGVHAGSFKHSITRHDYTVDVWRVQPVKAPKGFRWLDTGELDGIPLATMSRKALETAGLPAPRQNS
jgi:A/G-specific adenine glycosylase